jgi:hypothetical protein
MMHRFCRVGRGKVRKDVHMRTMSRDHVVTKLMIEMNSTKDGLRGDAVEA